MEKPDIDGLEKVLTEHGVTSDRLDPRLRMLGDNGQQKKYLVLSDEELSKGFIRPFRNAYVHKKCGVMTRMGQKLSETYAVNPKFYSATFCCGCGSHLPVNEFVWDGTADEVGS